MRIDRSLIDDVALVTAHSILDCLEGCLRPEEMRDALEEIRDRVRAGLECYAVKARADGMFSSN